MGVCETHILPFDRMQITLNTAEALREGDRGGEERRGHEGGTAGPSQSETVCTVNSPSTVALIVISISF